MGTLDGLRARKCWTSGHTSSEGRADLPAGDAEMFSDASLVPFVLEMESMDAVYPVKEGNALRPILP